MTLPRAHQNLKPRSSFIPDHSGIATLAVLDATDATVDPFIPDWYTVAENFASEILCPSVDELVLPGPPIPTKSWSMFVGRLWRRKSEGYLILRKLAILEQQQHALQSASTCGVSETSYSQRCSIDRIKAAARPRSAQIRRLLTILVFMGLSTLQGTTSKQGSGDARVIQGRGDRVFEIGMGAGGALCKEWELYVLGESRQRRNKNG